MKRTGYLIAVGVIVLTMCYIRGYRIITLEEIPNSRRPAQVFLSADYSQEHFTPAEEKHASVFDVFGQ